MIYKRAIWCLHDHIVFCIKRILYPENIELLIVRFFSQQVLHRSLSQSGFIYALNASHTMKKLNAVMILKGESLRQNPGTAHPAE